jgi:hypothetical protein
MTRANDIILGLPGETYESFLQRIEEIMQSGINNQLSIRFSKVLPGTELAQVKYQKKFKISTTRIPLSEIHRSTHTKEKNKKYEEVVTSTATMPVEDWKRAVVFSWVMQLLHGLKLGFFILAYLADRYAVKYTDFVEYISLLRIKSSRVKLLKNEVSGFYRQLDLILQGNPRGVVMPDFGSIYWEPEEASYLNISTQKDVFYDEMHEIINEYLDSNGIKHDDEELEEIITYQKVRVPSYEHPKITAHHFDRNIPEYFDNYFLGRQHGLSRAPKIMRVQAVKDYKGDKKAFAQEIVINGGKSDQMLYPVQWANPGCP